MFGLPLEVLLKIFQLLPRSSLVACLCVNQEFHSYLSKFAPVLWSKLVFSSQLRALPAFSRYAGPHLASLKIDSCRDGRILNILKTNNCSRIKELALPGHQLRDGILTNLIGQLGRQITALNLSRTSLSDASLCRILHVLKHLKKLDLSDCGALTASAFQDVVGNMKCATGLANLVTLNLSRCGGIHDKTIKRIASVSTSLECVFLEGCTGLRFYSLRFLQEYCPGIVNIKLTGWFRMILSLTIVFMQVLTFPGPFQLFMKS